jgi:aminopeptidase-like protein
MTAEAIYALAKKLFPLPRSITGEAVRCTHDILREVIPELVTHEIPTGTRCFDWVIPDEWNVDEAYIESTDGHRVVDWSVNNLHLIGYSEPVDRLVPLKELLDHVHSLPNMPNAIPYMTSYYRRLWGFCVTERQRLALTDETYRVVIRSTLAPGGLSFAEIIVPGESEQEVLLHTYTCHPSMGNNETSGMAVLASLARYVLDLPRRRYTYRIVFTAETIGAVAYINRNLDQLRRNVIAGFILTCVGDDRSYSLLSSRRPGTLPERVARHALERVVRVPFETYPYTTRGADERQYCAPGVDLPVVSVMRTKYGCYPEYHTSLDDLSLISPAGLWGGYLANKACIDVLEANEFLHANVICEPWLSPRGLRPPLVDGKVLEDWSAMISHIMAYADGDHDLIAIADLAGVSVLDLLPTVRVLKEHDLVTVIEQ